MITQLLNIIKNSFNKEKYSVVLEFNIENLNNVKSLWNKNYIIDFEIDKNNDYIVVFLRYSIILTIAMLIIDYCSGLITVLATNSNAMRQLFGCMILCFALIEAIVWFPF